MKTAKCRQHILADGLGRDALEGWGGGEEIETEIGDGRDAVAADQQRGVHPGETIDQAGLQQRRGKTGAALDQQPGNATGSKSAERSGKADVAVGAGLDIEQYRALVAQGGAAGGIGVRRR